MTAEEVQTQHDSMVATTQVRARVEDAPTEVDRDLPDAPTDPDGFDPPPPVPAKPETKPLPPEAVRSESEPAEPEGPRTEDGSVYFSVWSTPDGNPPQPQPVPAAPEPTLPAEPTSDWRFAADDDWGSTADGDWASTSDGWPSVPTRASKGLWKTDEVAGPDPGMVTIPPDVMKIASTGRFPRPTTRPDADVIRSRRLLTALAAMVLALSSGLVVMVLALTGVLFNAEPSERAGVAAPPTIMASAGESPTEPESDTAETEPEPEPPEAATAEPEPEPAETAAAEPELEPPETVEAGPELTEEVRRPLWVRFPGAFPAHGTRAGLVSPEKLDELLATLEECRGPIRMYGYAATGGGPTDDEVLALARAEFVREVLIDAGLPEGRLRAQSAKPRKTAEDPPLTEDDRPHKRRVMLMCKTGQ